LIDYIIPTYNSAETLSACIQSIQRFGEPKKIIIIDNESTDRTREIAEAHGCEIHTVACGIGFARRLGAKFADTCRIAFVDSDVELQETWQKVLASHEPIVSGYYEAFSYSLPHTARGKAGFIGCCILDRKLFLDCKEMDQWDYAEDSRFARWLDADWIILDTECIHRRKDSPGRWHKYGVAKRQIDGFHLADLKRIIGGAAIGYRMGSARNYFENVWIRYHYLRGYLG
jgi:glycosyltransferase involved in cell wall biosynthesis